MLVSIWTEPASLPVGSPAATVQHYLQAVAEGDDEAAQELLTDQLRLRCATEDPFEPPRPEPDTPAFQADLLSTEIEGDTAEVTVRITQFEGDPPFGGSGYDHRELFLLERTGDDWAIASPGWPYWACHP